MIMRIGLGVGVGLLTIAAAIWLGGGPGGGAGSAPVAGQAAGAGSLAPGLTNAGTAGERRYRGMAIQVASGPGAVEKYSPLIRDVAALGADTVLLCSAGYMEHAKAQAIFIDALKTPSPDDFRGLLRLAGEQGLRVILMPIVLLRHPRGSEWRGVIEPPDWEEWWRQYREFVMYFADIAQSGGIEAMMIGSELVSTEKQTDQWRELIRVVRGRFGGKLGYSANWDHYKPVQFWDQLDLIGMTSYYTLADKKGPSVEELVKRWQPHYKELTEWQRQLGRPIVFTEVGWCSQEGAATAPWNYYQSSTASPAGMEEQRRLYEAFLQVWDTTPGVGGIIWWEWTAGAGGPQDYGYTPKAKPAEQVLRRWFAAGREASPSPSAGERAQ
jgi:hypothetical protein